MEIDHEDGDRFYLSAKKVAVNKATDPKCFLCEQETCIVAGREDVLKEYLEDYIKQQGKLVFYKLQAAVWGKIHQLMINENGCMPGTLPPCALNVARKLARAAVNSY